MMMRPEELVCEACGDLFEAEQSRADAEVEFAKLKRGLPGAADLTMVALCSDCMEDYFDWLRVHRPEMARTYGRLRGS